MFKRRILVSLIVVALLGSGSAWLWAHRTPERLLLTKSRRVFDRKQLQTRTQCDWLDAHTLLLVTGDKANYNEPTEWRGKAERFDTQTRQRVPDPALTRMLNSLHAEPMYWEVGPEGKWLLWTVTYYSGDHYPVPLVSTLDGRRQYRWSADKSDETFWLNSHQWIDQEHHRNDRDTTYPNPHINVHDAEKGKQVRRILVSSPEAQTLLQQMEPDGKEYVARDGMESGTAARLEMYAAADYHLVKNSTPLRVMPLELPFGGHIAASEASPDHRHMFYVVEYDQAMPLLVWLHHWLPQVKAPTRKLVGLWTSRTDGTQLREIGHKERLEDQELSGMRWLADSRQLSWEDQNTIYTVPVE